MWWGGVRREGRLDLGFRPSLPAVVIRAYYSISRGRVATKNGFQVAMRLSREPGPFISFRKLVQLAFPIPSSAFGCKSCQDICCRRISYSMIPAATAAFSDPTCPIMGTFSMQSLVSISC